MEFFLEIRRCCAKVEEPRCKLLTPVHIYPGRCADLRIHRSALVSAGYPLPKVR